MPEMDGFEVLENLRSSPTTGNLPVVIVTAKNITEKEHSLLNKHAASVLEKSRLTPELLLDEIKMHLLAIKIKSAHPSNDNSLKDTRILVVEDNEFAALQIRTILESNGYTADVVNGGKEAVQYVQMKVPDCIILDLMMPDIDGFAVLEKIRSTEATRLIPVLVLTAKNLDKEDFEKLSSNNIQQLVQKGDIASKGLMLKIKKMLGEKPETTYIAPDTDRGKKTILNTVKTKPETHSIALPKVLVVEDYPDNMITIKAILKDVCTVLEAINGEEGLKTALTQLPDLVLLDISLPGMDGYAVLRSLKENEKTEHIPVIALTAHVMKGDRKKILDAGCDDYIAKPINRLELMKKLMNYLNIKI